ncbi:MAG: DUF1573 domain-containing protein [Thermoanaerobaculia bacterium]|nr:DUF1573 domain-containing protein [Thermoanaerobaculia bacterium]
MPSKSILKTISITFVIAMFAAVAFAAPRMTVVEPIQDFGTVPKGEVLTHSFKIKNTGDEDLEIIRVQPACGCTVADYDAVIAPGETGRVEAAVKTEAFSGPINKSVTIQTNDPDTPTAQVAIRAVVKPFVEAYPAGFVRFNVLQGETDKRSVILYSEEDEPFEIEGVDVPGDWVKVDYAKVPQSERAPVGPEGQTQYKVDVTLGGPTAPVGPLMDKVQIHTNSKHQPVYQLSMSGVIRPAFNVSPTVLNFGEIDPAVHETVRVVTVSTNSKESPDAFRVEKVESTNPTLFTAEAKPTAPGQYEVEVRLSKDASAGDVDGDLKIYTTDVGNPVVTIPVKGMIKG